MEYYWNFVQTLLKGKTTYSPFPFPFPQTRGFSWWLEQGGEIELARINNILKHHNLDILKHPNLDILKHPYLDIFKHPNDIVASS